MTALFAVAQHSCIYKMKVRLQAGAYVARNKGHQLSQILNELVPYAETKPIEETKYAHGFHKPWIQLGSRNDIVPSPECENLMECRPGKSADLRQTKEFKGRMD